VNGIAVPVATQQNETTTRADEAAATRSEVAPHGAEALGRLDSAEGGPPGRLTPTEDFRAVGALAPESEEGEDRPGGFGGEARSARGRSPLSRERVYDKTVHLQNDVVGDRRSAEHARWRANGWNEIARVTRVEFQVRGVALKEMDGGQLRDTARFVQRLDALWKYLTCKWVRLCVLDSASRRARWKTDPRWRLVQDAQFFESTGEMAERKRVRGAPRVEYAASIALSYAAKSGLLDDIEIPTLQQLARWTVTEARQFVLTKLGAILGAVGDDLARKLLLQRGPVRGANFVAERLRASRARGSSVLPVASAIKASDRAA
jgi:hypothetical protein